MPRLAKVVNEELHHFGDDNVWPYVRKTGGEHTYYFDISDDGHHGGHHPHHGEVHFHGKLILCAYSSRRRHYHVDLNGRALGYLDFDRSGEGDSSVTVTEFRIETDLRWRDNELWVHEDTHSGDNIDDIILGPIYLVSDD